MDSVADFPSLLPWEQVMEKALLKSLGLAGSVLRGSKAAEPSCWKPVARLHCLEWAEPLAREAVTHPSLSADQVEGKCWVEQVGWLQ
jgi:hypothetical protein